MKTKAQFIVWCNCIELSLWNMQNLFNFHELSWSDARMQHKRDRIRMSMWRWCCIRNISPCIIWWNGITATWKKKLQEIHSLFTFASCLGLHPIQDHLCTLVIFAPPNVVFTYMYFLMSACFFQMPSLLPQAHKHLWWFVPQHVLCT